MNDIDIEQQRRKRRAFVRLGTTEPRCIICGETDPHCLENHHLPGVFFSPLGVIVCCNCHRKLTDRQKDHPASLGEVPLPLETIGHFLLALADLFAYLVNKLQEWGHYLISEAAKKIEGAAS